MRPHLIAAASLVLLAVGGPAWADVIYREIFPNDLGTTNIFQNDATRWPKWKVHYNTGMQYTGTSSLGVSNANGRPQDLEGVASNPYVDERVRGFLSLWDSANMNVDYLYWTDEFSVALNVVTEIGWHQGIGNNTNVFRAAIRVDDGQTVAWYASAQTFTNASGITSTTFGTLAEPKVLTMAGASWRSLLFTPGSQLELGGAATLPSSGTITAFGLYSDLRTATQRFDTFYLAPEPATMALVGLGLAGLIVRRRGP